LKTFLEDWAEKVVIHDVVENRHMFYLASNRVSQITQFGQNNQLLEG
jgi:hypothetical protein